MTVSLCFLSLYFLFYNKIFIFFMDSELFPYSVQFSSVAQSCPTLCNPVDCSMPGFPVHHHSQSLLRLMPVESVMPSNILQILCI